jgi:hypothetical protein
MISKRIAFVSAIGFAVLALFVISSAEAASPVLNNPYIDPDVSRVDGSQPMSFSINYNDTENRFPTSFVVIFEGVSTEATMECLSSGCIDGTNPNGTWTVIDTTQPLANTLVANVGSDEINYNFRASTPDEEDACYVPCDEAWVDSDVRVNTIPVLTDDASVAGGGMPEDDYTLTITYSDADDHPGDVTATVCDATPTCESLTLSTSDTDFTDGAVYSANFNTELGGELTVTVSASDSYDSAADDRTTTFTVDTTTPWLKNGASSVTSAGENDDITFTVVYCVFDATDADPIVVDVAIASASHSMAAGDPNLDACKNGVDYSVNTTNAHTAYDLRLDRRG